MSVFERNMAGIAGGQPMLFLHDFGCDGNVRRPFEHVGFGA